MTDASSVTRDLRAQIAGYRVAAADASGAQKAAVAAVAPMPRPTALRTLQYFATKSGATGESWRHSMRIDYDDKGTPRVASYDPGDLVLLHSHESGQMPMGQAGDWGMVTAVSAGGAHVDIRIVGRSNFNRAAVRALTDIPMRIICPCDASGRKLALQHRSMTIAGTLRERNSAAWKRNGGTT